MKERIVFFCACCLALWSFTPHLSLASHHTDEDKGYDYDSNIFISTAEFSAIFTTEATTGPSCESTSDATCEFTSALFGIKRSKREQCLNEQAVRFVRYNKEKLLKHIAFGRGETVDSLHLLIGTKEAEQPLLDILFRDNFEILLTQATIGFSELTSTFCDYAVCAEEYVTSNSCVPCSVQ